METRHERLAAELAAMRALQKSSKILEFNCTGGSADRYLVTFHGRGARRGTGSPFYVEFINRHEVEIRLPARFPNRPPDIRWLTPIFHPNISYSGLMTFRDIGLPWMVDLGLDVICERLWDVARCHYMDLAHANNSAAQAFFLRKHGLRFPLDSRPLRTPSPATGTRSRHVQRPTVAPTAEDDLLVIDENTPVPDWPIHFVSSLRERTLREKTFHIGDA